MHRILLFLLIFATAAGLSSCCQPAHKNSNPVMVDSLFQESYGRDFDLTNVQASTGLFDSAYFPIYTFAIQNSGSTDDNFTLQLQRTLPSGTIAGFSITRLVPARATVLFQTPSATPDSITSNETFSYFAFQDSISNLDQIYYGLSFQNTDSTEIHFIQPTISIVYGSIDNGPEGCNTPASTETIDVNTLPVR